MIYAAVLAGGSGSRMGNTDKPKQFLDIGGMPVIAHTTLAFITCSEIDRVLVVTPAEWVGHTAGILRENLGDRAERATVLPGGNTRNETLMNAVRYIEEEGNLDDETIIVTQDAVRPFVTRRMILENIDAVRRTGACETAFPATDTIIESDDGRMVGKVPDRAHLWSVQTPQSFRAKKLLELYSELSDEERASLTDAAGIFVMKEQPVEIVMGDSTNIKITYPRDLVIAEAILEGRE